MTELRKSSLVDNLVEILGTRAASGDLDGPTSENAIAAEYRVSRTTTRHAVSRLVAKGVFGSRPNTGTWVQARDKWNLLDPDVLRWLGLHDPSVAQQAALIRAVVAGVPGPLAEAVVHLLDPVFA